MSEWLYGALLIAISVVITREQILQDLEIGTHRDEVVEYFEELTDEERISFITREDTMRGTVSHDIREGEKGYYIVGLRNVQENWWWPSFGSHLTVIVVISEDDTVTEIKFVGSRTGWP